MTPTPDFDDLTPPQSELNEWEGIHFTYALTLAYRAGARHGFEQARQLWPEPITDRPPTEADGDALGWVMILTDGVWRPWAWSQVGDQGWLPTPRWQPRQPTLKEQGLADVADLENYNFGPVVQKRLDRIRRALEQAGEGVE